MRIVPMILESCYRQHLAMERAGLINALPYDHDQFSLVGEILRNKRKREATPEPLSTTTNAGE